MQETRALHSAALVSWKNVSVPFVIGIPLIAPTAVSSTRGTGRHRGSGGLGAPPARVSSLCHLSWWGHRTGVKFIINGAPRLILTNIKEWTLQTASSSLKQTKKCSFLKKISNGIFQTYLKVERPVSGAPRASRAPPWGLPSALSPPVTCLTPSCRSKALDQPVVICRPHHGDGWEGRGTPHHTCRPVLNLSIASL